MNRIVPVVVGLSLAATAAAVDMDTLPEPYRLVDIETGSGFQYGVHPVPGMTLPILLRHTRDCTQTPTALISVPPDGSSAVVEQLGGDGGAVVFADASLALSEVLAAVPEGMPIRAAALYSAERPQSGTWCGPLLPIADARARGPKFQAGDLAETSSLYDAIRKSGNKGHVVMTIPPTAPWADVALWTSRMHFELTGLQVLLDAEASPPPSFQPALPALDPPDGTYATATQDGVTIARFETPTRLAHASGQVLATYDNGGISVLFTPQAGPPQTRVFEVEMMGLDHWKPERPSIPYLEVDGSRLMRGRDEVGAIQGEPYAVQTAMIQLGLASKELSSVTIAGLAEAHWDGRLTLAYDEAARWSAQGIRVAETEHTLAELSAVEQTDDGPRLACKASPDVPATVFMTADTATFTGVDDTSAVRAGTLPLGELDHAQVRAACVGAAITFQTQQQRAADQPNVAVTGGVIGGQLGLGVTRVHQNEVERKRLRTPSYPEGDVGEFTGRQDCVVEISIDAEGVPSSVKIVRCPVPFQAVTEDAVMRSRWYPYKVGRQPVPVQFLLKFVFVPES